MNRRWSIAVALTVAAVLVIAVALFALVRRGGDEGGGPVPESKCPAAAGAPDSGASDGDTGPGTLVDSEEIGAPGDAQAWKITYCSTGREGQAVDVTGQLVVPSGEAPADGFPLIAYAHGFAGAGDQCAPSARGVERIPYVQDWLAAGYAVVATDYAGLGTEGTPGFLVGESEARSVLDSVRAAANMSDADIGDRTVIVGYSQGGHSALFSGELAPAYAPEIDLVAVAALAPPTDVEMIVGDLFAGEARFGLAIDIIASWAEYYGLDAGQLLTERGLVAADQALTVCAGESARGPTSGFVANQIQDAPDWSRLLSENNTGQRPIDVPVFVGQAANDTLVPARVTRSALPGMCEIGTEINFIQYPGATHRDLPNAARSDVIEFVEAALAGDSVDLGQDCTALG